MATEGFDKAAAAVEVEAQKPKPSGEADEIVSVELPAPTGWIKKYTPKKSGTPRRNEIVFISPTGEEIKNKRQLEQFLKAHPGGPALSEFEWGTGDTPRRSARIIEKSMAIESPESEPPKKRERKSSSKKKVKNEDVEKGEAGKEEETTEGDAKDPKRSLDAKMKEAEDAPEKGLEETGEGELPKDDLTTAVGIEEAKPSLDTQMEVDVQEKSSEEVASGEVLVGQSTVQGSDKNEEMIVEKVDNVEADDEMDSDVKEVQLEINSEPDTKEVQAENSSVSDTKEEQVESKVQAGNSSLSDTKEGQVEDKVQAENSSVSDTKGGQVEDSSILVNEGQVGCNLLDQILDGEYENILPPVEVEKVFLPVTEEKKESEAPTLLAGSEEAVAEKDVKGAKEEESVDGGKVGADAFSEKDLDVGQSLPDTSGLKDGQEANAKSFEEANHQAKPSPVNC